MKRLLIVLVLTNIAYGDDISIGPDGINSKITGLNGSSPLTGGVVIGQVEAKRSGKPGYDDFDHSAAWTNPYAVYFDFTSQTPAPNTLTTYDDFINRDHATRVAGVMIESDNAIPGVAPGARLHSMGLTNPGDTSQVALSLHEVDPKNWAR